MQGRYFFRAVICGAVTVRIILSAVRISGKIYPLKDLPKFFLNCRENADNIELVTPTHFIPDIVKALDLVKNKINIPVIYNSGGYELCETIDMLDGYIDVYLPDLKYFSPEISGKYSRAENYFEYASKAVTRMTGTGWKAEI